jgi:hypothetical protein
MQSRHLTIVTMLALIGLALPLVAQQREEGRGRGPGGPGGGGGMFFGGGGFVSRLGLLRVEAVQKELDLVDEQLTAIQKLQEEMRPMGRGFGPPGGTGDGQRGRGPRDGERKSPDRGASQLRIPADWYFVQNQQPERRPFGGELTEEQRREFAQARLDRARQEKAKLAEILLPHQMKRLNEIYYQQMGVAALDDEDVAKELNISASQKEQIAKVREENQASMRSQMQELFQNAGDDREATMRKAGEMRRANDKKLLEQAVALLTAEQKQKLEELRGKPFDLPEGALFGRGGPGGPGGPRGRGPGDGKKGN